MHLSLSMFGGSFQSSTREGSHKQNKNGRSRFNERQIFQKGSKGLKGNNDIAQVNYTFAKEKIEQNVNHPFAEEFH